MIFKCLKLIYGFQKRFQSKKRFLSKENNQKASWRPVSIMTFSRSLLNRRVSFNILPIKPIRKTLRRQPLLSISRNGFPLREELQHVLFQEEVLLAISCVYGRPSEGFLLKTSDRRSLLIIRSFNKTSQNCIDPRN